MSWLSRGKPLWGGQPRLRLLSRRLVSFVLVGIVSGLGACLFYWLLQAGMALFLGVGAHFVPPEAGGEPSPFHAMLARIPGPPIRWLLVLMPALGGLISGWLVFTFAPEAEGHGTDSAILAFHRLGGRIRGRVPILKTVASAITLGTGGSGGREGPIAQIGAGFGSFLATQLGMTDRERRLLVLTGMGAGVGAIFKAPLAGAIFAGEVLYRDQELEYEALFPTTVASIIAYSIFASVFGWQPLFITPQVGFRRPLDLVAYTLLGFVCAGAGWLYIKVFYGTTDLFHRLPIKPHVKPMIGGLLTGLVGLIMPAALATSYGQLQAVISMDRTLGFMLALAFLKIITTSFSIGSGGSGGVFGPAMVIGGCVGGATGLICQRFGLIEYPSAMVLVGMAGFFAGAANTPLSTIIMVSEMTGNYYLLVPSMWTCTLATVLLRNHSLYHNQVRNRQCSPAHTGELAVDILQTLHVEDWMTNPDEAVPGDKPLTELIEHMADAPHTRCPVIGPGGEVQGVLDVRDVLTVVSSARADQLLARHLMDPHFGTIEPDQDLHEALSRLDSDPHGMLMVSEAGSARLQGVLRRQNILHAYHQAGEGMLRSVHRDESGAVHLPADITVGEAMTLDFDTVRPDTPLGDLAMLLHETGHHGFPVVDEQARLVGIVTLSDYERREEGHTVVDDIMSRKLLTCFPYETLVEALRKFGRQQVGRIPVVDPQNPAHLVGLLRRGDIVRTFSQAAADEAIDAEAAVVHALDVPQARFIEYRIARTSPACGRQIRELTLPADCLIVSIRRGPSLLVPHGDTEVRSGDRVIVLCAMASREAVQEVFGTPH